MQSNKTFYSLALLCSVAVSFALYANSLHGAFLYDDDLFNERPELRQAWHLPKIWTESYVITNPGSGIYRPVATTSFSLNYILFGPSSTSFHVINVLLNGLVVFCVFLLMMELFGEPGLAAITALVFAFFPIHTMALDYIKSRDDLLGALAVLISWLAFLRLLAAGEKGRKRYAWAVASAVFYFLALGSKELTVIAPVLFVLSAFVVKAKLTWKRFFSWVALYFVPLAFYMALRVIAIGKYAWSNNTQEKFLINPLQQESFWTGIWTAFKIAYINIGKTIIPVNLSSDYGFNQITFAHNPFQSVTVWIGLGLLAALVYFVARKKWRWTAAGVGAMFFLVSYFFISKFFLRNSGEMVEENWMYFPSLGFAMIMAYGAVWLYRRQKAAAIIIVAVVLAWYGWVVIRRNPTWRSEQSFFESMSATSPNSWQGHYNLALVYGRDDQDVARAKQEAERAYQIYPKDLQDLLILAGIAINNDNDPELAIKYSNEALQINSQYVDAHKFLAYAMAKEGRYEEALPYLNILLQYRPNDRQFNLLAALCNYKLGRIAEARKHFGWDPTLTDQQKIEILDSFEPQDLMVK